MRRNHTIKDIANLAGVSKGTVDRVIHKRGKVSKKAFDKINAIIEEIDYQPNLIARNLKNNKSYSICVLIPDPNIDPYWLPCIEAILAGKEEFTPFNIAIEIFYFNPESTTSFLEINSVILNKIPDAVLLVPLFYKETLVVLEKYNNLKIPIATFNNQVHSKYIKSFVGQDLIQSGRVAAKLLDSILKKKHIAIIHINEVFKNAVHMQEKEKGFRDYFEESKNIDYEITTCKIKSPNFEKDLVAFLQNHPSISGVFVTTSKAYQVAEVLEKNNKQELALVGYDLLNKNNTFLKNGQIDFLIHQNQKEQAYLALTYLTEYCLYQKEIPKENLLPINIINSENIKYYVSVS